MFNSISEGGHARATASNHLKINAVSGILVKNHPKSIFVTAKSDSNIFDPTNPRYKFPKAIVCKEEEYDRYFEKYKTTTYLKDVEISCVVLQALIIGDGLFLCEIVTENDFYGEPTDEFEHLQDIARKMCNWITSNADKYEATTPEQVVTLFEQIGLSKEDVVMLSKQEVAGNVKEVQND